MKLNLLFVLCPAAVLMFSGCAKDHLFDCLKGSGKEISVVRPVGLFHRIELHNKIDLEFHRDAASTLTVTCGANLIDGIVTEISAQTLIIRNENKCNWVRDFNKRILVIIHTDSLWQISNYGSGNINFADTLYAVDFQYDNWNATGNMNFIFNVARFLCNVHTGTANVSATGSARESQVYTNAYGFITLDQLSNHITYVTNSGTGDVFLSVEKELYATIEEAGNIYYSGNPIKIEQTITGSGKLIKQ